MSDESDQIETEDDGFEIDSGDELQGEAEVTEAETDDDNQDDSEEGAEGGEKVPAKKLGYVEFDTPEQQQKFNMERRLRSDAERERDALRRELEQYKKPPEPPKEVPIPSADHLTDPHLFAEQMNARDKYMKDLATFEAQESARQKQAQDREQQKIDLLKDKYNQNAKRLGVNSEFLLQGSRILDEAGIKKELAEFLLDEDDGPAIVAYLAKHPDDAYELVGMSPLKVGSFVEKRIRSKLNAKPVSKAPPPTTKAKGTRGKSQSTHGWTVSR